MSSDRRFDSDVHLETWQRTGKFPAIHDAMFALVISRVTPTDGAVVDFGSSIGMLSRRLHDAGFDVRGIEASKAAIAAGLAAGAYVAEGAPRVRPWKLLPQDMDELEYWMAGHQIRIVVARRVLPPLDDSGVTPSMLSKVFVGAGVQHIFLEGMAPRPGMVHRLPTVAEEIEGLGPSWKVATMDGVHRGHLVRS